MRTKIMRWHSLAILLAFAAGTSAWAKNAETPTPPAADATLTVGETYTIRAERSGAHQQFTGELVKVNDQWIVLRHVAAGHAMHNMNVLAKVPLIGPKLYGPPTPPTDEFLWIPRDAAAIEKQMPTTRHPAAPATLSEAPPSQVSCAVEMVVAARIVRRDGGLEALTDEKLTLSVPKKVRVDEPLPAIGLPLGMADTMGKKRTETRYTRVQVPRHDVLCIRVANFDPAILAERGR